MSSNQSIRYPDHGGPNCDCGTCKYVTERKTMSRGFEKQPCECGSTKFGGCEYAYGDPNRYDGVSEWVCLECGNRFGRWTGNLLKDGQSEPPFGEERR